MVQIENKERIFQGGQGIQGSQKDLDSPKQEDILNVSFDNGSNYHNGNIRIEEEKFETKDPVCAAKNFVTKSLTEKVTNRNFSSGFGFRSFHKRNSGIHQNDLFSEFFEDKEVKKHQVYEN